MSSSLCRSAQAHPACLSSSSRTPKRVNKACVAGGAAPWQPHAAAAEKRRQGRRSLRVRAIGFELPGAEPAKSEEFQLWG